MSLPGSVAISPQARDITFTFRDSFNCCRSCRTPEDQLYVNSQGQIEPYKVRKANGTPGQSFERAMKHLNETMERKVVKFDGDPDVFARKVDRVFQSINALKEINRSHIEAINALMLVYLQEESPRTHVQFEDQVVHPAMLIEEPRAEEVSSCLIL